jgi:hypothetical protein
MTKISVSEAAKASAEHRGSARRREFRGVGGIVVRYWPLADNRKNAFDVAFGG